MASVLTTNTLHPLPHLELVAFLQDLVHSHDALMTDLADVQQASHAS